MDVIPREYEQKRVRGGRKATLFVYGLENMAYVANSVSLVTYFMGYINFSLIKSANTLTNFLGTSFLLAILGGLISDKYLTRFKNTVLFGCVELLLTGHMINKRDNLTSSCSSSYENIT